MKWMTKNWARKQYGKWVKRFAWLPVCVADYDNGDKKHVWLQWIEIKEDLVNGWTREIGSKDEHHYYLNNIPDFGG